MYQKLAAKKNQTNSLKILISTLVLTFAFEYSIAAETKPTETKEIVSDLTDQKDIAVTIYNNNLALVKDKRLIKLNRGINDLALRDVSALIRPETAILTSISHPGSFATLEQNFDFDLLTPNKLLEKYVGQEVTIAKINPKTGEESTEKALILSANDGVILKIGDRIETGVNGRIIYHDVPSNLRDRPTLVTQLDNQNATTQMLELSYLTTGLGWQADYVASLNAKETAIDLSGWVTLNNTSGTSYHNAHLQLVAGDVNIDSPSPVASRKMARMEAMVADAAPMVEESLLEYHLYSLDRTTSIKDKQTKQVALLSANNIPAKKELILNGEPFYYRNKSGYIGQKIKATVYVEFENKKASKLGMPLPRGVLRAYKKDSKGNTQFIGEDRIDHTPNNETVRLKLGEAFDVTADKVQTDFKVIANKSDKEKSYESAYRITLKNAKSEKVTVTVQEPIPADWKILKENYPSTKLNSHLASWKIDIPAESSKTLTYSTLVKY